jgi:ribosomal protein S18 acetylase RimI-like enzyme
MIDYRYGNDVDLDTIIELFHASTLGKRRPVDDRAIVADMMRHANLVVTAWEAGLLVGVARTLTDFSYVGYLSDLAVRDSYQRRGIGVELVRQTREKMGPRSMIVLLSAPQAVGYYPRIGFTQHESAWLLRASDPMPSARE